MARTHATNTDRAVWQHYLRFWGEPAESWRFDERKRDASLVGRADLPDIVDVMGFVSENDAGVRSSQLATIGLANRPMHGRRAELELTVRGDLPRATRAELARILANLTLYPFIHDTFFDSGHLIKDISGLARLSTMRAAFLQRPLFEDPDFAQVGADGPSILWVVPIHDDEYALASRECIHALETRLEQAHADVLDLRRPSALR